MNRSRLRASLCASASVWAHTTKTATLAGGGAAPPGTPLARDPLAALPQRPRRHGVASRGAADAQVDAPGKERLQHAEGLGDLQGAVVLEHHAARAHTDPRRARGDLTDQDLGARAPEPRRRVVLGQPVAVVAEAVTQLGELERLVDRVRRCPATPHRRLIEDREARHLVNPLLLAPPLLLAQHELLDLSGGGLRQVTELDGGGTLEVGDVPAAELDELPFRRRHVWLQGDERLGPLAPLLVRDGDHRALEHGGVLGDSLLDLHRRDVLAARDDDVLLPVAQLDVAVRVPHGEVTRVEPAAAEGLGGRAVLLEVALR